MPSTYNIDRKLAFLLLWMFSFIPISGYLFGNGYLNYYDPQFPFFSGYEVKYLYTLFVYTPETGISPNTQSVLYLFMYIIPVYNIIILAKIYLILIFSAIYLILWRLTDIILDILNIHSLAVKILLVLFFYLIPLYIQLIAFDWFTVILGILSLLYVLINLINIQHNKANPTRRTIVLSGIALGFSAMMDPRFYIWFIYIITIFLLYTISTDRKLFMNFIKSLVGIFFVSLPFVIYVYYIFIYPSLITVPINKAVSFSALRPDSLSYIAGFSQNSNFIYLFAFISNWWPSVIPSSPSILFYPRIKWFYLPAYGFNDQILLPNDLISYIWFSSLFIFIFIVFISIFDKSRRKISSELLLALLFMIGVETGTNFTFKEFTYIFDVLPSKLPVIGGIMSTTFAIPFYAEWTNISLSLILTAIGFNYIINFFKKIKMKYIIGIALILVMSFASWQYFNGTLYPGQRTYSFPGNGISLEGYYYPLNPPPQWIHVMNILSTSTAGVAYVGEIGFSEKWTNYQFISYSPPLIPGYATISPPPTTYVNQTPLAYDIAGIKYLFIDNTSYIPLSNYFIYSYLNNSGLKAVYAKGDVYLLEQPNASVFRYAKQALSINTTNESIAFEVEDLLYPLLNYTPAIISPHGEIKVLVNPTQVTANYMAFFNESLNVSVSPSEYIILNGTRTERYLSGVIHVSPNTLIIPVSINLSELVSYPLNFSFNQLTASFTVNVKPGYIIETSLPLPNGGVIANGGNILGQNVFGQTVILSNSNTVTLSIKLGFFTNVLMTLVDIFYYFLFVYFIIYKGLRSSGITMVILNVIRNSRFKGNK
ncbi:hypothetical protein [Saccharolobus islandicus]|uniref:hypothetical protein n=1 Tax=Saccharolobus islandicus TaxID=43080 RepID=UPI00036DDC23|nr:hypothetical protein [Sulfolobus islandicus]